MELSKSLLFEHKELPMNAPLKRQSTHSLVKHIKQVEQDSEFWSRVRGGGSGNPFQFVEEGVEEHPAPNSMMEAMKVSYRAKARGKKVKFVRGK